MIKTEYDVIERSSREDLVLAVQAALDKGWSLLGGISIAVDPGSKFPVLYAQAVARDTITIDDGLVAHAVEPLDVLPSSSSG